MHGRPRKMFQGGGQRRKFAYRFKVSDDAMHIDVHKMLYLIYPINQCWLNLS